MSQLEHDDIANLFQRLLKAPRNVSVLAQIALEIAEASFEASLKIELIAKKLGLFLKKQNTQCFNTELRRQFSIVEESLSDDLRGFSQLFDFAVEDRKLLPDRQQVLLRLVGISPEIAVHFQILKQKLQILEDLEQFFDETYDLGRVLIFADLLKNITTYIFKDYKEGQSIEWYNWIQSLRKKSQVQKAVTMLDYINDWTKIYSYCLIERNLSKDLIMVFLTNLIYAGSNLDSHVALEIDALLKRASLTGIEAFFQAGYLSLQDSLELPSSLSCSS